ncbi:MAG: GntR family transcriptional regulator [Rubrivivax sp.]
MTSQVGPHNAGMRQAARRVTTFQPIAPHAAGMPLYRAVKRALLRAIEDGALAPGAALDNETLLAAAFEVSIGTLRQAVSELVAEHILVRRQGRGTFVATHSAERFLFQFFHVERNDGLREAPSVELLQFDRGRLDEEAAEALGRKPGDAAWLFENRLVLQGRAVVHDRIVLPAALFRTFSEKRLRERPGTIYRLYQDEFAITVVRALERASAIAADRAIARVLGLAVGTPMLQVRRTALTFGDKPVEYRVSTLHTALHDYVQTLSRSS